MTASLPKAELHLHLEGSVRPDLIRELAAGHGITLDPALFTADGDFAWTDFVDFLRVYDATSVVVRTRDDYRRIAYDYLARSATEGAIYVEMIVSSHHAAMAGLPYPEQLDGIVEGIESARAQFGIEARILATCVRHEGPEAAIRSAREAAAHPHPLVTGFHMGGNENLYHPRDFAPAYRIAAEAGLRLSAHAGEAAGAESVRAALDHLPIERVGHGVRAVEDATLLAELASRGLPLEVCPNSNIATRVYPSLAAHPLPALRQAGCRVTLNSDDPPYFGTSIGHEYATAAEAFGLDDRALVAITRTAIDAAFCDEDTRAALHRRIDGWPTL
ncbi:adenosine deaminase [Oceanibacterium hippocampi]|uniref:Aminodeoxyfutalosine deaminase n=1 Tax=Oceanibacterium hippocampi TaxID=745714 RepID=A0A1Y5TZ80_9PROT|nr:adenosine deaminase [Oceanibacterium hippocampi]SLN74765.1 Aminodeoxyfutalosine deaminase [Oceanibacterium hippocampi]